MKDVFILLICFVVCFLVFLFNRLGHAPTKREGNEQSKLIRAYRRRAEQSRTASEREQFQYKIDSIRALKNPYLEE